MKFHFEKFKISFFFCSFLIIIGRYSGILSEEKYNRIWTQGDVPPNCIVVPTLPDSTAFPIPENEPPNSVMSESIASSNTSTPIILSVDLPTHQVTPQTAYFVFYFTEQAKRPSSNDTRIMDIYVDGRKRYTVAAEVNKCKVVSGNIVSRQRRGPQSQYHARPRKFVHAGTYDQRNGSVFED